MAGKLVRNTSTEELRRWWDAVEEIAAKAPRLAISERDARSFEASDETTIREASKPPVGGDRARD